LWTLAQIGGYWTRSAIKFFPHAHYTLIEPQPQLRTCVNDLEAEEHSIDWIDAGCSNSPGRLPFTVAYRDDASRFVSRSGPQSGSEFMVDVLTINQVAATSRAGMPDMVKIDAEGLDLQVLSGASTLFGKTEIFMIEAVIAARVDYTNTLSAVVRKMDSAGYSPLDITSLNRSPKSGVLWVCEMAFVRNGSSLLSAVSAYE
jgi:FkbM family methyltransferase